MKLHYLLQPFTLEYWFNLGYTNLKKKTQYYKKKASSFTELTFTRIPRFQICLPMKPVILYVYSFITIA